MNIKSSFISVLTVSLFLITQTAHADFRKALDAYIARDGDIMLKEVKDAVSKKSDDRIYADSQIDLAIAITQGAIQVANIKGDWLDGGEGEDVLIVTNTNDLLLGGADDDVIFGNVGMDLVIIKSFVTNNNEWRKLA